MQAVKSLSTMRKGGCCPLRIQDMLSVRLDLEGSDLVEPVLLYTSNRFGRLLGQVRKYKACIGPVSY